MGRARTTTSPPKSAANEDRLPVAVSTTGGVVTTGKMVWATSRYRFEANPNSDNGFARGCCNPGVSPISETSLIFENVECTAYELFTQRVGSDTDEGRYL